jgi:predicted amidohydrolase
MRNNTLTRRGFLGMAAGAGLGGLGTAAFAVNGMAGNRTLLGPGLGGHDQPAQEAGRGSDCAEGCAQRAEVWKTTSDQPPRKVIVGTVMQPFWGRYPGLEKRLQQLAEIVERLQAQSQKQYGRGLDLAVLPEMAVTGQGESVGHVVEWSYPLEGPVRKTFARSARHCRCYIVAPLYLLEDKAAKRCSNAAVLFDRQGEVAGIYRKVHLVVGSDGKSMEHGAIPGKEVPVFACDFGKLGIQICYDMDFDYGWRELARKGAEIVAWPSQSPQRARPVPRAIEGHYYIVSSTWRKDACVIEPTGKILYQVTWQPSMGSPGDWNQAASSRQLQKNILVQEIDLSYAILPYSRSLKNGELFNKTFGNKAGFRYYDDEDRGIFWSNDPHTTVRQMVENLNLTEEQDELRHAREVYRRAGVPGY